MKNTCRICGKEFEPIRADGRICGYDCRKKSIYQWQKKKRETDKKKTESFSLDVCPFGAGLIKPDNWYYDELKPCEV